MSIKQIKWDSAYAIDPDNIPDTLTPNKPLADLYEKLKASRRGWGYRYAMDSSKRGIVALRIFDITKSGDPIFLGGVTIERGRDHANCYAIRAPRINLARRATYKVDTNTKLVKIEDISRAVAVIKEYMYPETIEERIQKELARVRGFKDELARTLYAPIETMTATFTGYDRPSYSVTIDALVNTKTEFINDVFAEGATLESLRAKYDDARRMGAELQEQNTRRMNIINMMEKIHRVTNEGDVWAVRSMQGSAVGATGVYKTFEEMPEKIRNGVVALRMLGEGLHEGIGVNLDAGNVFWIYETE